MNAGYVRLSRDDDKQNYVSIENQKLIIQQHAAKLNMVIDRWYEDDGVSGYKFDRPAFVQLKKDLQNEIDVLFAKDLSRIGRHNAYVLLFLDEFYKGGNRLIVVDDDYDSDYADDDIIGIKTWYNERYIKDTSKKIRRVLGARQKEGTLMVHVPFGYIRNKKNKEQIEIIPKEAEYKSLIDELYIHGMGYRKISTYLNEHNIPTPSILRHERELANGKVSKLKVAAKWTDSMVRDVLDNDFYTGIYRLHKRARVTIHGTDKRVPKDEQIVFENHHPAITSTATYELIQEIKHKRNRHNYRGSKGQWAGTKIPNPFGSCLYCKDCGNRLTPIVRTTARGERKYYICSTYNTKGRTYCSKAHLIEQDDLMNDVLTYIQLCRDTLCEVIATYDLKDYESEKISVEQKYSNIQEQLDDQKKQLKSLISQKLKDLAASPQNHDIINETYDALQKDILAHIHGLELQLKELADIELELPDIKDKLETALDVVDRIIVNGTLDRRDIEILIDEIVVDENGLPYIKLKYGLSNLIQYDPVAVLNKHENKIILTAMQLIYDDDRGYTSAKFLANKLTISSIKKSVKSVQPYLAFMMEKGILAPTDNKLKPYSVIVTRQEFMEYIQHFHNSVSDRWNAPDGI